MMMMMMMMVMMMVMMMMMMMMSVSHCFVGITGRTDEVSLHQELVLKNVFLVSWFVLEAVCMQSRSECGGGMGSLSGSLGRFGVKTVRFKKLQIGKLQSKTVKEKEKREQMIVLSFSLGMTVCRPQKALIHGAEMATEDLHCALWTDLRSLQKGQSNHMSRKLKNKTKKKKTKKE